MGGPWGDTQTLQGNEVMATYVEGRLCALVALGHGAIVASPGGTIWAPQCPGLVKVCHEASEW